MEQKEGRRKKINCNHHHLADVESLDIEIKHKKREKNYLKNYIFSASLFLHHSLFTSKLKKNQVLHTTKEKKPHTTFPHQKIYIISRSSSRSAWLCKWPRAVFEYIFHMVFAFSPATPYSGLAASHGFSTEIMTDNRLFSLFSLLCVCAIGKQ